MGAVYKKELKTYFTSPIGYVVVGVFLIFMGLFFRDTNLSAKVANFGYALASTMIIVLIVLPILTMRLLSEEQKQKTDQLLFSVPIKVSDIVLGKFFAVVTLFSLPILIACTIPPVLSQFGEINFKQEYSTIFAFWMLGCVLLALGILISATTESQVVAAVLNFGINIVLYYMSYIAGMVPQTSLASVIEYTIIIIIIALLIYWFTKSIMTSAILGGVLEVILIGVYFLDNYLLGKEIIETSFLESTFTVVLSNISFFNRFFDIVSGSFDISTIIYYGSFTAFFLFLTMQLIQKRRWS